MLYNALQYALSLLSLLYLQQSLPGNSFNNVVFLAHVLAGGRLSHNFRLSTQINSLPLHCINSTELGRPSDITSADHIENTAYNSSSTVASHSCRTDGVENTASQLVHWCLFRISFLATVVFYRVIT
jgi:hypothetical protein